jgi:hypothetical protein
VHCSAPDPLLFGVGTLAMPIWGAKTRTVGDGTTFRPQGGRVSMLTGLYSAQQTPQRWRTLQVRMTSERFFDAPISVRVCMLDSEVPSDLPAGLTELSPPRLLPLTTCVEAYGGTCDLSLGYVNSSPDPIYLKYGSRANQLVPSSMQNGFTMPSTFLPGIHWPTEFTPPLYVTWSCDFGERPDAADWRLDGLNLYLDAQDQLCGEPPVVTLEGIVVSAEHVAMETTLNRYRENNPYVTNQLQDLTIALPQAIDVPYSIAQFRWAQHGVVSPQMSVVAEEMFAPYLRESSNNRKRSDGSFEMPPELSQYGWAATEDAPPPSDDEIFTRYLIHRNKH